VAKKVEQGNVEQIQQEEKKLQEIEERIDLYSAKAREFRNMVYSLQAGEPNRVSFACNSLNILYKTSGRI
jgi:hypothetical protein